MRLRIATLLFVLLSGMLGPAAPLTVKLRDRTESDGRFTLRLRDEVWDPAETAIIVCDMWDAHHCFNAVQRGEELVPRIDALLKHLRSQGALVIHSPSSCMAAYQGHPARQRALDTPAAAKVPQGIGSWLHWIDEREEAAGYPIDASDGGCDDTPAENAEWAKHLKEERGRDPKQPWRQQAEGIEIDPERDAITDQGGETWSLLQAHGAKNALMVGVHTNMCVLGRPFGLRQLAKNGVNVALVRDLTDSMYNPAMPPMVSHYAGTDLVIEHIEKYVCPTVSSEQFLSVSPHAFKGDDRPNILFLIGEREYETEVTLPRFAAEHLTADYRVRFLMAEDSSNDFGEVAAALADADAVFISVRRRALEARHLDALRAFVAAGNPVLGIRTASHGFSLRGKPAPEGHSVWDTFDPEVFGGSYHGHHGNKLSTSAEATAAEHPILEGLAGVEFATGGSLYEVLPLAEKCTVLLEGSAETIEQKEPVAWTFRRADGGRSFYTSLGHVDDFERAEFVSLLKNALRWVLGKGEAGKPAKTSSVTPRARSPDAVEGGPLPPEASLAQLRVPDDLVVDLVLSEPLIAQPLHLSFDARGRLWVVQYRQYPDPAGLKELSRDKVWRVAYDRVPPPPPHPEGSPFRGKDRISIHEDTNGDGRYDLHKVFADGLNLATSVAHGAGGIWVTNPPYLLFFPDRDGDDVPDSAPEVHLKGFGLEDTHSIANSLVLAPDGWLYGAQGSTVSAAIVRPGIDEPEDAVRSMGQHIWRYHPASKTYEIFAEGGGNAFGVEIDSRGHVFSGHNGGDTRGFHYIEGGYFQKTWGKHGALTNPHAYGYFPAMKHDKVARFVHQFLVYEDDFLPERYRGKMWGVDILHHNIVLADLIPDGSTYRTEDIERVVRSKDPWFRPVMVTDAPDGSVYIADWYDEQVNHYKNHEGQIDKERGRIYRVRSKDKRERTRADLSAAADFGLITAMSSNSRWKRRAALQEWRKRFPEGTVSPPDALPLQSLWLRPEPRWLDHADPAVRREAVRLAPESTKLKKMAREEQDLSVLAQLAATARRVDVETGLAVAEALSRRDELANDPHIPLLVWWAIEHHLREEPGAVLHSFRDSTLWQRELVRETLLSRLMRRLASEGDEDSFQRGAELLRVAPDDAAKRMLIEGLAQAMEGRSAGSLPAVLLEQLSGASDQLPLPLRLRIGDEAALPQAIATLAQEDADSELVVGLLDALEHWKGKGKGKEELVGTALLAVLGTGRSEAVELAALSALQGHRGQLDSLEPVFRAAASPRPAVSDAAASFLATERDSALALLARAKAGQIDLRKDDVALAETFRAHDDSEIEKVLDGLWGESEPGATAREAELARVGVIVRGGGGVPKQGERHFEQRCASCHTLFGKGGNIGPDLTSYQREDREALLLAVVAPGVEIREGYEHTIVKTKSGAVLSGFRLGDSQSSVVLRDLAGGRRTVRKDSVDSILVTPSSLMPPGLLNGLNQDEIRDLFAYLRSTTPPF